MLEELHALLTRGTGPSYATVGEAYLLHNTLAALSPCVVPVGRLFLRLTEILKLGGHLVYSEVGII